MIIKTCAFGCAVIIIAITAACKREARVFQPAPTSLEAMRGQDKVSIAAHGKRVRVTNWYEQNAYAVSEGQRLFEAFNCVGCHGHGGGGVGPALMDAKWIYGSDPAEVYSSIMYGRLNGMPAFNGRIREAEAWEIAAYVRSLAGLAPKPAAPGRSDEMNGPQPPSTLPQQTPENSSPRP